MIIYDMLHDLPVKRDHGVFLTVMLLQATAAKEIIMEKFSKQLQNKVFSDQ